MRVAFTGGGTGGHIYPCLAVAELFEDESNRAGAEKNFLYYIGGEGKLEQELCLRKEYIQFLPINAPKLPSRNNSFKENLEWFGIFFKAYKCSVNYLRENKIDVVMGTGGYVAAPVFLACVTTKTKFLIHNLDSNFGLVNKLFKIFANCVSLGFPSAVAENAKTGTPQQCQNQVEQQGTLVKQISSRLRGTNDHYTGNPVSQSFINIYMDEINPDFPNSKLRKNDSSVLKVLITGGSQGSQFVNDSIGALLKDFEAFNQRLAVEGKKIFITHITGSKLFDEHVNKYLDGNSNKYHNYKVLSYTHEMANISRTVDIAICRAGAMTCAEMAVSLTVPILIPLPWAAHDHQTKNAEALVKADCAFMIRQDVLSNGENVKIGANEQYHNSVEYSSAQREIANLIFNLAKNPEKILEMKKKLYLFAKPESSREIFILLKNL